MDLAACPDVITKSDFLSSFETHVGLPISNFYTHDLPDTFWKLPIERSGIIDCNSANSALDSFVYCPTSIECHRLAGVRVRSKPGCVFSNCNVYLVDFPYAGCIDVMMFNDSNYLFNFSSKYIKLNCKLRGKSVFVIGQDTSCVDAKLDGYEFSCTIGLDSMLSEEIVIQASDEHAIVDCKTNHSGPKGRSHVCIGRHVWVGRRAFILKNVVVGDGSIVGASALITKSYPRFSVIGGNPGRLIKSGVSWARLPSGLSDEERFLLDDITRIADVCSEPTATNNYRFLDSLLNVESGNLDNLTTGHPPGNFHTVRQSICDGRQDIEKHGFDAKQAYLYNCMSILSNFLVDDSEACSLIDMFWGRINFDDAAYLRLNPDVAMAVSRCEIKSGFHHWIKYGIKEKRRII
ncbi:acyltransferase [Fundidesulfovibrio agrisoli]|uniref:acyltransferase n=1 Tax=Fundidesulfovibrio agrisoli TaxID=2922717 RepID=UPI001FAC61D7|nr:acyltransferase [Fundidesulfovibrio agrisoli]